MRPLSMIKIAMFVILVPGAALGDTELDVERIIEDVLKKKAENGEDKAQYMYMLGNICYNQEKYLEALKWYTEAAAKGHTDAQFALGSMYFNGMGIQKDYSEALKWYTEAAAKGHTDAQYMLGNLYSNQKDYSEALKWYTEAAAKGHTDAQYMLGFNGHGNTEGLFRSLEVVYRGGCKRPYRRAIRARLHVHQWNGNTEEHQKRPEIDNISGTGRQRYSTIPVWTVDGY